MTRPRTLLFIIIAVVLILSASLNASAEHPSSEAPYEQGQALLKAEGDRKEPLASLEYEIDAYYSNVGLYISLTDAPIPDAGEKAELLIYKDLLLSSYIPRFLVLEAAIFPMPDLGVFLKKNSRDLYDSAEVMEDFNLIKAVTTGFQEPYAFSIFLGNVISFSRPGEAKQSGNFGYMGYLLSIADHHIKDNELVKDTSYEIEWKIKGDRRFSTHKLSWSFRIGGKLHENPDIKDALYLSLRRSRLDFEETSSIWGNSGFEYQFDVDAKTLAPLRHYFTIDRKWPWKQGKIGFALVAGFVWEAESKYTGSLADAGEKDDFQFILRPNVVF